MRKIILIIGIVILAVLIAGCTQSSPSPAPTAVMTTLPAQPTSGQNPQVSVSPGSIVIPNVTPVAIPPQGLYVYVNYIGGFSGSFGTVTNMTTVQDSGEKLYLLDPVNGTVMAGFAKLDHSSHPLEVRIYEDSQLLKTGTTSDPNGMVNISVH